MHSHLFISENDLQFVLSQRLIKGPLEAAGSINVKLVQDLCQRDNKNGPFLTSSGA